jgi:hypothetical protein
MRTSTDGVTWTSDQDLALFSFTAPGIGCRPGGSNNCLLSYARGETTTNVNGNPTYYPNLIERIFQVDSSSGAATLDSASSDSGDWIQRTPPVVVAPFFGDRFWTGEHWTNDGSNWANGIGTLYSIRDYSTPQSYSWDNAGVTSGHTLALAASQHSEKVYAFYVNP